MVDPGAYGKGRQSEEDGGSGGTGDVDVEAVGAALLVGDDVRVPACCRAVAAST